MHSGERGLDTDNHLTDEPSGRLILRHGQWTLHELVFTPGRIGWLGEQLSKYPSLTTDPTKNDPDQLWRSVSSSQAYWTEVRHDEKVLPVGLLYLTSIQVGVDAQVHPVFFDRVLSDKVDICRAGLRWAQEQFFLHRFTAALPEIYFATVRLARKIGFKQEGLRREVYLINGKWCDELVFGLLSSEM